MIYEKTKRKFIESYQKKNFAVQKFKSVEYILNDFNKYPQVLASLVAWVMGDGSFSREFKMNLHGQKEDLVKLATEVKSNFDLDFVIKKRENKNSHYLYFLSKNILAFNRLLHFLGAPVGEKVKQSFFVPEWIMHGNKEVKRRFLQVLFSNELDSPKVMKHKNFFYMQPIRLRMFKIKTLEDSFTKFFNQVKLLCLEFGIKTSKVHHFDSKMDKEDRICLGFYIKNDFENILRYFKEISYPYSDFKQTRLNKFVPIIIEILKKDLEQNRKYDLIKELYRKYKGPSRIRQEIDIPISTLSYWLYYNVKPRRYDNKELPSLIRSCEAILKG